MHPVDDARKAQQVQRLGDIAGFFMPIDMYVFEFVPQDHRDSIEQQPHQSRPNTPAIFAEVILERLQKSALGLLRLQP